MWNLLSAIDEAMGWGKRFLSSFHMKPPLFNLVSSSRGRISNFLNSGRACSQLCFEKMTRTAFFMDALRPARLDLKAELQFRRLQSRFWVGAVWLPGNWAVQGVATLPIQLIEGNGSPTYNASIYG